jgi:basic amino acid/polyamine antiporter, APA family
MARRGDLPRWLERLQPQHAVPDHALALTGGVVLLLALTGSLKAVISTAAFTILLYYGITNLAALRLPREQRLYAPWVAGLGLGFCLALASSLSLATAFTGMGLLASGFLVRAVLRRTASRR